MNRSEIARKALAPARTVPAVRLLLRYLEEEGVKYIFGIPGGPIMPLYEAIFDRDVIKPVLCKHEEGAAFMADGYARASGDIGVCCTTTGPGATNALTGIAVAYADRTPVLLLTAQTPTTSFGKGAFQESGPETIDLVELYRPVTKWSTMIQHPGAIGPTIRKAMRILRSGQPGPVHINIPCNLAVQQVPEEIIPPDKYRFSARTFDRSAVRGAAAALLRAKRPVILAGHGVNISRAWGPLRVLAERLRIPVATTFKAKGAFPEDHPLSLGVLSYSGDPRVQEYLASPDTDLMLVVGTGLGEASSCGWDPRLAQGRDFVQIDVDPVQIGRNYPVDVAVVGDAGSVLIELRYQLEREFRREGPRTRPERPEPPLPILAKSPLGESREPEEGPLKPLRVLQELREALPRDAALFVDNGTIRAWTGQYFPVYQERSFFVNMGLASMGYAVAGSIGGKLASPNRAVVALVGDAAFAMNGMEVHTAVEHRVPVVWVVVNNGGHGMIYHGEKLQFGGKFCSSKFRRRLDIAELTRAVGAISFSAQRPGDLTRCLEKALFLGMPCVIDVATDLYEVPPMGSRVNSLKKDMASAA